MILTFCCAKKTKSTGMLTQEKMREVMWDLIRADQYVSDYLAKDSTRNKKNESRELYEQVFHLHKITGSQFKTSLDYYTSQPDLFRPIIDSLAKRKKEFMLPPSPKHIFNADSSRRGPSQRTSAE
jgi:hypothetical protein